jgi:alkylation response protein AidB-like acyl-CoA dehydrogenase
MASAAIARLFADAAELDPELIEAVRDSVRAFARKRTAEPSAAAAREREWGQVAEAGWFGLLASEERGGAELPASILVSLYEALGRWGVADNYAAVGVLALVALECCDEGSVRNALIESLVLGAARPVLCWQTRNAEDERNIAFAPAEAAQGEIRIALRREYVEFADTATDFCFPVESEGRPGLLVVARSLPGLEIDQLPQLSGVPLGVVSFEGTLPAYAFLPLSDHAALRPAFILTRIAVAAQLTGLMEKMIELTSEYTAQRVQFGKPLASNQVVQHRLADMWGQKELAKASVVRAGAACASGVAEADLAALAAKAIAGSAAEFVTKWAFQLHGAIGYTGEYALGGLAAACLSFSPWLGSPRTMRRRFVEIERAATTGDGG